MLPEVIVALLCLAWLWFESKFFSDTSEQQGEKFRIKLDMRRGVEGRE